MMKLTFDMHTHTTYSHGKATLEEMVEEARRQGLRALCISDHGRSHPLYGVKKKDFKKMREENDALNEKYDDIDLYLSVESNIIGGDGTIDIQEEELQYCDWIYAGYHYVYIPASFHDLIFFTGRNYLSYVCPWMRKKTKALNTQTYCNMMDKYDLKMITHPGDKCPIDIEVVGKKAAEKGVILEINPRHSHLNVAELKKILPFGGKFAINSDAHTLAELGSVAKGIAIAIEAKVPIDRIVNCVLEKTK